MKASFKIMFTQAWQNKQDRDTYFNTFKIIVKINTMYIIKNDVIWENLPHVAQDNFAEINKILLKLLCFSLFFTN